MQKTVTAEMQSEKKIVIPTLSNQVESKQAVWNVYLYEYCKVIVQLTLFLGYVNVFFIIFKSISNHLFI